MHMNELDYEDIMNMSTNNYAGLPVKYIVAGNYNEYQAYVKRKPRIEYYYKYVAGIDTIRGLSEINGAFIGTYDQRLDIEEIKTLITIIKSKQQIAKAIKYQWKDAGVGFVAQEIQKVLPDSFFEAIDVGNIDSYINGRLKEV